MSMQQPTCSNTRIRSTHDAHKIFFAVQHGILPLVTRRLDADERLALRSGCVYCWEERSNAVEVTGLGIERFTEGRRWSPSRVRDEFLFYYEKYTPPHDASQPSSSDRPAPRDWDPLVKQTYSVWNDTANGRRKWHLTAYFTQATVDQLGTINDIPGVGNLFVPEGLFQSTRTAKNRKSDPDDSRNRAKDVFQAAVPATNNRKYAAFSAPYSAPSPTLPEMVQPQVSPVERYPQNSLMAAAGPYYPEIQMSQYPLSGNIPPLNGAHELPPLHEADRRGSIPNLYDSNTSMNGSSSPGMDVPYHTGMGGVASQPNMYGDPSAYSSQPVHQHAHLRERFGSYPRELQPASGINDMPSLYGDQVPAWQQVPTTPSAPQYNIRPPYTSTSSSQSLPYTQSSDQSSLEDYSHSVSSHSSDQTSPTLSNPHHSPFIQDCVFPDERQIHESGVPPSRVKLAPLHSLRNHPYRRDPVDDKALRLLRPRAP